MFRNTSVLTAATVAVLGLGGTAFGQGDSAESVEIRFGNHYEPAHPNNACGAELMAEALSTAGSGINLAVYPAAQLGTAPQMVEQLAIGELEMAMASPADLGAWHDPMSAMDAAYAFDDFEQLMSFVDSEKGQELYQGVLDEANVRIIGTWLYGTRHMTANQPLRSPEDLEGLKIRAPDAPVMLANVEAMGGSATPMAFGEVYLGLQQGVIDAQENPLPSIQTMKFFEVQDYLMLTGHVIGTTLILVSEPFWQSLSQEQRDSLTQVVDDASSKVQKCIEDQESEILANWREGGNIEVVEDVAVDEFREAAREFFSDESRFSWAGIYSGLHQ